MPTNLGKNLNLCFTKIKFPLTSQSSSSPLITSADNSLPLHSSSSTAAAATTTGSSLLYKNYNSLYDNTYDFSTSKSFTHSSSVSSEPDTEHESDAEPDFAAVLASQRFFFTSPGSSSSIVESTHSATATTLESSDTVVAGCFSPISTLNQSSNEGCDQPSQEHSHPATVKDSVAVPTFSPNPYMDFRRSMQEMVEARQLIEVKANWDYLHELLLCYLALNPESTHKFIIGAFADLVVSLLPPNGAGNDGDVTEITGGRIPGKCM